MCLDVDLFTQSSKALWLLSGSGVLSASLCDQAGEKCLKKGSATPACVVDELEEAEIARQLVLRDTSMRTEPRPQQ